MEFLRKFLIIVTVIACAGYVLGQNPKILKKSRNNVAGNQKPKDSQEGNQQPQRVQPPQQGRNQDQRNEPQQRREERPTTGLAASPECADDIERLCRTNKKNKDRSQSNLDLLVCLTNHLPNNEDLAPDCHHYLWEYKLNITKDPKFDAIAREHCKEPISQISECSAFGPESGKLIPCLLDHKEEIKPRPCYHFLVKMGTIIYSDYRLICDFVDQCATDISTYKCGKVDSSMLSNDASAGHSQGSVISCLEGKIVDGNRVDEKCAKQIVRLTELSADDYHMDRNLYFSCKDDREKFCENIPSGEGRVYKCLYKHKFDPKMSTNCRGALTLRQKLVAQDYKASYNVHTYCQKDIDKNHCLEKPEYKNVGYNDHKDIVGLSGILLCLEDAKLNEGDKISEQCDAHLVDFRRMLSEDYEINPEIVSGCSLEITNHCEGVEKKGQTIHCLMGLVKTSGSKNLLGEKCEKAIMHLLKENEAAYDYRMDYALSQACSVVVKSLCKDFQEGDPMVLSCLMENMYSTVMTTECQKRLIELQYFISRDFFLDPVFNKKCKKDARSLCEYDLKKEDNAMPLSIVISCLYRHIEGKSADENFDQKKYTSQNCADEVYKVMSNRALDVNLNPDLEQSCMAALGKYCSDDVVEKDSELLCLQDNFESIQKDPDSEDCIAQLEELTELEEEDPVNLDNLLMKACQPEVEKWCSKFLDQGDEGQVMQCLIDNKLELNTQCEAGVNHFQLIEIKDVKFNYKFMKSCKNDIDTSCPELKDGVHTKLDVISCLSAATRNAVLQNRESPISDKCQQQLTVENLQAHEDYRLDPELSQFCQSDFSRLCHDVKPGNARGIECLRENKNKLSKDCKTKLFGFEKEEADNRNLDFSMMRACKASIKTLCQHALKTGGPEAVLDCLIHHRDQLDKGCREIVVTRQREEYSDFNLHPELKHACMNDIHAKCSKALHSQEEDEENGNALQGRVIECLKEIEISPKKSDQLSAKCSRHIKFILQEETKDYSLDPMLALKCVTAIDLNCKPDSTPNVVECLKQCYFDGKLKNHQECTVEVARLLKEGRYDIMADPILHNTCLEDISVHCPDVAEGKGRIMNCLIHVAKDKNQKMTENCKQTILQRQQMWSFAAKNKDMESFGELGLAILNSPHQSYFLTILTLFLLVILVLGVLCGRVTKRVSRQRKML